MSWDDFLALILPVLYHSLIHRTYDVCFNLLNAFTGTLPAAGYTELEFGPLLIKKKSKDYDGDNNDHKQYKYHDNVNSNSNETKCINKTIMGI